MTMTSIRDTVTAAMRKWPKDDPKVEYSAARGTANHHCGPDRYWRRGYCRFFEKPDGCSEVSGDIASRGACDLWQRAKGA
jgi:hypothetical protein